MTAETPKSEARTLKPFPSLVILTYRLWYSGLLIVVAFRWRCSSLFHDPFIVWRQRAGRIHELEPIRLDPAHEVEPIHLDPSRDARFGWVALLYHELVVVGRRDARLSERSKYRIEPQPPLKELSQGLSAMALVFVRARAQTGSHKASFRLCSLMLAFLRCISPLREDTDGPLRDNVASGPAGCRRSIAQHHWLSDRHRPLRPHGAASPTLLGATALQVFTSFRSEPSGYASQ